MRVKITAELHNGALHGNTYERIIEIDDEDIDGYDEARRNEIIDAEVKETVLNGMVGWDWAVAE